MIRTATCHLRSASPYSQSRSFDHDPGVEKPKRGESDLFDQMHWRKKCHSTADGRIRIPQMSFKMAMDTAAKMEGTRVPGKGQATYTKYFLSGVLCADEIVLDQKVEDLECDTLFVNADGVRGSGKRVWKRFPRIDSWEAVVNFIVLAPEIPNALFENTLVNAGRFVGIGRFRPQNGGYYGRFGVEEVTWS